MGDAAKDKSPAQLIEDRIAALGDWRGALLAQVRGLIKQALPEVIEEWKWRGVPVWYDGGMICTGETYKAAVKLTFAKGAALADPAGLFNASLEGNVRRAIDFHEGDAVDAAALVALVQAAAALNRAKGRGEGAITGRLARCSPMVVSCRSDEPAPAFAGEG